MNWERTHLASIALTAVTLFAACGQAPPVVHSSETPDASAPTAIVDAGSTAEASADVTTPVEASAPDASPFAPQTHCELFTARTDAASTCKVDSDCEMTFTTCCGPCGQATVRDVAPISKTRLAKGNPYCTSQSSCPDCEVKPPNLKAACVNGVCALGRMQCPNVGACAQPRPPKLLPQVQPASVAACGPGATCVVTYAGCCAPCGIIGEAQSVAANAKLVGKLRDGCDGGSRGLGYGTMCPQCAPGSRNPTVVADCVDGLCRVRDLGLDPSCAAWTPMRD